LLACLHIPLTAADGRGGQMRGVASSPMLTPLLSLSLSLSPSFLCPRVHLLQTGSCCTCSRGAWRKSLPPISPSSTRTSTACPRSSRSYTGFRS
jgi:hypothetical protein